ncbi:MAG TPA: M1 family aminopeptidase [Bryobacteraceae bacterium]|nr:M1 family aminopeptidase [Bryobacteraceae bacterium]
MARALRETAFDPAECYRVRDLTVFKEDIRIYLTDGHLIFSRPVAGRPVAAVFTADTEGGDGEVLLLPPDRAERRSLAAYIQSPNLDEHFRTVLLLFTGGQHQALAAQMAESPSVRKAPETGELMAERWNPVLHNLAESFQVRLTLDLLGGPRRGDLLAGLFSGVKLGNFDLIYDPESSEQILAAQVVNRNGQTFYDTWTNFRARSLRGTPEPPKSGLLTSSYRIDATVDAGLALTAVTRVKVRTTVEGTLAAPFEIATPMAVTEASVDGQPAEVLQRDSLRPSLARGGNSAFLVVPREPMHAGRDYEFEFHHTGKVIADAGDRIFFVAARGNWYPVHGLQFASYDLRFHYPKDLDLVTPGDVVEDRTEGDWRITRRRTSATIRMAGFNLGNYAHARVERGGYVVDVCANRTLEQALAPRPVEIISVPAVGRQGKPDPMANVPVPLATPPDPLARLAGLASEVASAMQFMASKFGPPALPHLTVSPIPGSFGQGFPGLIYLSTLAYLKQNPGSRSPAPESQTLFFEDLMEAHETAHQWWGNRVAAATYRDYWLMEALANYSALMYMEKTKGTHALDVMLDSYRGQLLEKGAGGQTVESAGPIVLGSRLSSSLSPAGWNAITYGKGSWILHMLRRRMGDARFFAMLAAILQRYDHADISTEEFRMLAASFLPKTDDPRLEAFFDQWVYGTGIPGLKLAYTLKGTAPALRLVGTVTQSDADDNVSVSAPVEIQIARGNTVTEWVRTASEPAAFSVALKQAPLKVTLDPNRAVLRR